MIRNYIIYEIAATSKWMTGFSAKMGVCGIQYVSQGSQYVIDTNYSNHYYFAMSSLMGIYILENAPSASPSIYIFIFI